MDNISVCHDLLHDYQNSIYIIIFPRNVSFRKYYVFISNAAASSAATHIYVLQNNKCNSNCKNNIINEQHNFPIISTMKNMC